MIKYLIGIDEAGRGPLAGPVSLAAVVCLNIKHRMFHKYFAGARDSKKLSAKQREEWWRKLKQAEREGVIKISASFAGQKLIDERGIAVAIKIALARCLWRLAKIKGHLKGHRVLPKNCLVLLDGSLHAPKIYQNQQTIIRGDDSELIIALASIIAKVRRDRLMVKLAKKFPGYGLEVHKGYGTRVHYRALKKLGLSALHRHSFLKSF